MQERYVIRRLRASGFVRRNATLQKVAASWRETYDAGDPARQAALPSRFLLIRVPDRSIAFDTGNAFGFRTPAEVSGDRIGGRRFRP